MCWWLRFLVLEEDVTVCHYSCSLFLWKLSSLKLAVQFVINHWLTQPSQIVYLIIYSCSFYMSFCYSDLSNCLEVNVLLKKYRCYASYIYRYWRFTFPRAAKPIVFIFSLEDSTLAARFITRISRNYHTGSIPDSVHTLQKAHTEVANWLVTVCAETHTVYEITLCGINAGTVKVNCSLVQALRLCTGRTARRGSRSIALPFHDHGTRRGRGVSVAPRLLFTPGKNPVPIVQEAGWAPGPVWTGAENLAPTGIQSPDRPARSQSLYRLRYPANVIKRKPLN